MNQQAKIKDFSIPVNERAKEDYVWHGPTVYCLYAADYIAHDKAWLLGSPYSQRQLVDDTWFSKQIPMLGKFHLSCDVFYLLNFDITCIDVFISVYYFGRRNLRTPCVAVWVGNLNQIMWQVFRTLLKLGQEYQIQVVGIPHHEVVTYCITQVNLKKFLKYAVFNILLKEWWTRIHH